MKERLVRSYAEALEAGLPVLVADVTWIKVNGGYAASSMSDWKEDRAPVVGEEVPVSGGGPFVPALIDAVLADGEIRLRAPQYA